MKKLIGKTVNITNEESTFCGEWGIIKHFDGEYYHIAIANDPSMFLVFERDEFEVRGEIKC